MKKTLLITTHCPTQNTQSLANACFKGAFLEVTNVRVVLKTALETTTHDVLQADAIIIGTTENIGYMGGLTKDFFDRCYNSVLEKKQGLPMACYIRAGLDGTGTKKAIESITTGLKWQWVQEPLILKGEWQDDFLEQVATLTTTVAVGLDMNIF